MEKQDVKIFDTREYVSVLKELVEAGKEVSITIYGGSMTPFLIHNRDKVFFSTPERPLRRGDMVFYQRLNGQYVMHRIYKVTGNGYSMIGDAQTQIESPVREEQIFARITKAERKGKLISQGDFWWDFFAKVWIRIIPLRPTLMHLYGTVWGKRHKNDGTI